MILTSFILAFSSFTRALLSLGFSLAWTKIVTYTRIYSLWIQFKIDSQHLTKMKMDVTRKWKEAARAAKQKRREERQKSVDEKKIKELKEIERENGAIPAGVA